MQTLYQPIAFSPLARLKQSIGEGDAVISVDNISAFPDAPNLATIGVDENAETILYTAKTEDSLSGCTRGVEGAAKRWQAGEAIGRNFTAKDHADIIVNLQEVNQTAVSKLSAPETATDGQVLTYRNEEWKAETPPESGVSSFNGRTGAITPQDGDYTAAQVGAIPEVTGAQGQFLGFTAENVVGALDAPKGGGSGKKYSRFVVGTSTAGWTSADVDYLCDGTDDQVEINAAIQALPSGGGEVVILDGTYNISKSIAVNKVGTILKGNRMSTLLKAMNDNVEIIKVTGNKCTISNLSCNGNSSLFSKTTGISCSGNNNAFIGNVCESAGNGIVIYSTNNSIFIANNCVNNLETGMRITTTSNSVIVGNSCNNNQKSGITASGSNNTITGNICKDNITGIDGYNITNNIITGNVCIRGTGTSGDYTSAQHTIKINGKNNLVTGNNCMGKSPVDSGTNTTLSNNKY